MNASSHPHRDVTQQRKSAGMGNPFTTFFVLACVLPTGCVALNIPSQRHLDPSDRGGVFGAWENPARPGRVLNEILIGPDPELGMGGCGGELIVDGSLTSDFGGEVPPPPPPEVPWPKYHPIPTRPVFGGSELPSNSVSPVN